MACAAVGPHERRYRLFVASATGSRRACAGAGARTRPCHAPYRRFVALTIYPSRIYSRCMVKSEPTLPLTPAVFHILLALFGRRHGYDIMQQVKADLAYGENGPGYPVRLARPHDRGGPGRRATPYTRAEYTTGSRARRPRRARKRSGCTWARVARRQLGARDAMTRPAPRRSPGRTPLLVAAGTLPDGVPATASRGDAAKFADLEEAHGVEDGAVAAYRKGPDDEPHSALFRVTAWPLRDRCLVTWTLLFVVGISFTVRRRPSGLACFPRLSGWHAVLVHRDTSSDAAGRLVRGGLLVACHSCCSRSSIALRWHARPSRSRSQGFLLGMLSMLHCDTCLWNAVRQLGCLECQRPHE